MHWAARKGNTKMVKTLQSLGAHVDPKDLVMINNLVTKHLSSIEHLYTLHV